MCSPFDTVTACWAAFLQCRRCRRVINLIFLGSTTHKRALSLAAKPIRLNEFDRVLHQQFGENKNLYAHSTIFVVLVSSIQICVKYIIFHEFSKPLKWNMYLKYYC